MREIKFRVWDKKGNRAILFGHGQQFTGLKDKNNKEIYEGDIVKYSGDNDILYSGLGIVSIGDFVYDRHIFYYGVRVKRLDINTYFGIGKEDKDYLIMGNIFETPELLENK